MSLTSWNCSLRAVWMEENEHLTHAFLESNLEAKNPKKPHTWQFKATSWQNFRVVFKFSSFFSFWNENMVSCWVFFLLCFQTLMNVRSCQVSAKVEIASTLLAASSVNAQKATTSVKRQESVKVESLEASSSVTVQLLRKPLVFSLKSIWGHGTPHPYVESSLKSLSLAPVIQLAQSLNWNNWIY